MHKFILFVKRFKHPFSKKCQNQLGKKSDFGSGELVLQLVAWQRCMSSPGPGTSPRALSPGFTSTRQASWIGYSCSKASLDLKVFARFFYFIVEMKRSFHFWILREFSGFSRFFGQQFRWLSRLISGILATFRIFAKIGWIVLRNEGWMEEKERGAGQQLTLSSHLHLPDACSIVSFGRYKKSTRFGAPRGQVQDFSPRGVWHL